MAVLIGDANAHQCHYATAGEAGHHTQQILNGRIAERRDKARGVALGGKEIFRHDHDVPRCGNQTRDDGGDDVEHNHDANDAGPRLPSQTHRLGVSADDARILEQVDGIDQHEEWQHHNGYNDDWQDEVRTGGYQQCHQQDDDYKNSNTRDQQYQLAQALLDHTRPEFVEGNTLQPLRPLLVELHHRVGNGIDQDDGYELHQHIQAHRREPLQHIGKVPASATCNSGDRLHIARHKVVHTERLNDCNRQD